MSWGRCCTALSPCPAGIPDRHRCGVAARQRRPLVRLTREGSQSWPQWSVTVWRLRWIRSAATKLTARVMETPQRSMETPQKSMPDSKREPWPGDPPSVGRESTPPSLGEAGVARGHCPSPRRLSRRCSRRTATGCSSSRPMRRFRRHYVLLEHFLGEIDQALEDRIAVYLRAAQADHGGWSLYVGRRSQPQRDASRPTTRSS